MITILIVSVFLLVVIVVSVVALKEDGGDKEDL
jgi:hypothetical protein